MINFPDNPTIGDDFASGSVVYTWDGTKWKGSTQKKTWVYIAEDYTFIVNTSYAVDFSSPRVLTMPANPTQDDTVFIYNTGGNSRDSVIARNGNPIMEVAEDLTIDYNIVSLNFIYDGTSWRISL